TPILRAVVRDPTTERLSGRMLIYDVGGRPVSSTSFPLPQGSWRRSFDLADLEIGWYRAVLEVENPQQLVGRRSLDVVVLPARDRSPREQRFGIVLPSLETGGPVSVTRKLARHVGAAHALVPLWDDIESAPPVESAALRGTVEELLERGVEVTLVVPGLARKLARLPQPDPPAAGGAAEGGPTWLSALRHAAMTFGLGVPRWLIGAPGGAESLELVVGDQARLVLDAADRAMAGIVPQPVFLLPWPAEYEPVEAPVDRGFWMTVPYHVRPEALADYAAQWPVGDRPLFTTIERLPAGAYAPCDRAADLMLRGLYGWRAGLPRMAITAPWACRDHRAGTMPDPSFAAWRTLADQLDGRTFGGALPVADGIRCWILAGSAARDTALVAWSERAEPDAAVMRMLLAEGPVQVVDAFSGRRDVEPRDGVHTVDLGPRPLFIEGVDPGLAAFRAGFGIQPSFLTARHQVHECEMLLSNPWSNTITGTLRLQAPEGWRVTPRIHRFAVPPGQIEALPISVVMRPGAPTGGARIEGEVELIADRPYRLRVHANLNVGLENIEFAAHWRVDRNERTGTDDLIVTQTITNNGPRPVALYAYVSAPGMSRQRHPVGNLTPGQKTVQTFRLPDGARLLAGKRIRVGVIDDDGVRKHPLRRRGAEPALERRVARQVDRRPVGRLGVGPQHRDLIGLNPVLPVELIDPGFDVTARQPGVGRRAEREPRVVGEEGRSPGDIGGDRRLDHGQGHPTGPFPCGHDQRPYQQGPGPDHGKHPRRTQALRATRAQRRPGEPRRQRHQQEAHGIRVLQDVPRKQAHPGRLRHGQSLYHRARSCAAQRVVSRE
ncbi:MAG: hypothetical protein ACYTE6_07575, partial [Planctomycetota bacterium]